LAAASGRATVWQPPPFEKQSKNINRAEIKQPLKYRLPVTKTQQDQSIKYFPACAIPQANCRRT
jgi:hypothetical protein